MRFLFVIALTACTALPRGRSPAEQAAAAVEVRATCADNSTMRGSGVIVDERHALTARHVIICVALALEVVTADGRRIAADVDAIAPLSDVARLSLRDAVPVRPAVVDRVHGWVCLVPVRPERRRRCGTIVRYTDRPLAGITYLAETVPGNSGAGLYDARGRLVGIVTHKALDSSGLGFAAIARQWYVVTR